MPPPPEPAFDTVFEEELRRCVAARRGLPDPAGLTADTAFDHRLVGLSLSGGGIRSAAFNLGLLQALANEGTLQRCDYLSTVSGGGYIGACLTSLCSDPEAPAGVAPDTFPLGYTHAPDHGAAGPVERPELQHVRQHGKYLAVRGGPFRGDLWRMLAAYLGGLALTWLTVIAILVEFSVGSLGMVSGLVEAPLDDRTTAELWARAIQIAVADDAFGHVPDAALLGSFERWGRSLSRLDPFELGARARQWLAAAQPAAIDGTLRAQLGVWTSDAREYAADREALAEKWSKAQSESRFEALGFMLPMLTIVGSSTLPQPASQPELDRRLLGARQLLTTGPAIDGMDDAKARTAVINWLGSLEPLSAPLLQGVVQQWMNDAYTLPVTALRERVPKWAAESRRVADDEERLRAVVTARYVDRDALLNELTAGVWRHPARYVRSLIWVPAVPVALVLLATVALICGWLLPTRIDSMRLRDAISRLQGRGLALALVFTAVVGLPFLVSAIDSLRARQELALSTLALSGLALLSSSLSRGDGRRAPGRLKRWLLVAGAWGAISIAFLSVVYVVIHALLDTGSAATWVLVFAALVWIILGLAMITDINRVSLLLFYRDRLGEAFVIRSASRPARDRSDEEAPANDRNPPRAEWYRRMAGVFAALGGWPLAALAVGLLIAFHGNYETAVNIAIFLGLIVFVTGISTAVVRRYTAWLGSVAHPNDAERAKAEIRTNDALRLSALTADRLNGPYPLINAAVNLAGSDELERLGRKTDFFLLSPLYCGSASTGYARTERLDEIDNLATAMALSSAAANPQYGPSTAPAFTFLMALCNARLGMWIDNPSHVRPRDGQPGVLRRAWRNLRRWWPYYLVRELLGKSDEKSRFINVSDGGHIENLGIYELLRRRCRVIIASDAGADPEYAFGDLANLTRMARIDLGIEIQVAQEDLRALKPGRRTKLSGRHVVVGEIRYDAERVGKLVYIKASLTCDDPHDLHGYQKGRPAFPHETTVDQFFAEEQFESYRELGYRCGLAAADAIEEEGLLPSPAAGAIG